MLGEERFGDSALASPLEDRTLTWHQATIPGKPSSATAHPEPAIPKAPSSALLQECKGSFKRSHSLPGESEDSTTLEGEPSLRPSQPAWAWGPAPAPASSLLGCRGPVLSSPREVGPAGKCGQKTKTTLGGETQRMDGETRETGNLERTEEKPDPSESRDTQGRGSPSLDASACVREATRESATPAGGARAAARGSRGPETPLRKDPSGAPGVPPATARWAAGRTRAHRVGLAGRPGAETCCGRPNSEPPEPPGTSGSEPAAARGLQHPRRGSPGPSARRSPGPPRGPSGARPGSSTP